MLFQTWKRRKRWEISFIPQKKVHTIYKMKSQKHERKPQENTTSLCGTFILCLQRLMFVDQHQKNLLCSSWRSLHQVTRRFESSKSQTQPKITVKTRKNLSHSIEDRKLTLFLYLYMSPAIDSQERKKGVCISVNTTVGNEFEALTSAFSVKNFGSPSVLSRPCKFKTQNCHSEWALLVSEAAKTRIILLILRSGTLSQKPPCCTDIPLQSKSLKKRTFPGRLSERQKKDKISGL